MGIITAIGIILIGVVICAIFAPDGRYTPPISGGVLKVVGGLMLASEVFGFF